MLKIEQPKIPKDVCFVAVTYNRYGNFDWTKICATSFRRFFPTENLVFVDHNHNPEEKKFLERNDVVVIEGHEKKLHGLGLDCAAQYCRAKNYKMMIVMEPDCVVYGKKWAFNLISAIQKNYKMATTFQYDYGMMHPCVSIWDLKNIPYSFDVQSNKEEVHDHKFKDIINYKKLFRAMTKNKYDNGLLWFFTHLWDTGMRNSYFFQKRGKAVKVDGSGIRHCWASHVRGPKETIHRLGYHCKHLQYWVDQLDQIK